MKHVTTSGRRWHWPSAMARVIAAVGLLTGLVTLVTAGPATAAVIADISGSTIVCSPTSPVTNPPFPGATVTCTVTIKNSAAAAESATDLGAVVTLPAGVTPSPTAGDSRTATTVTFANGAGQSLNAITVAPGGTKVLTFTATINTVSPPAPGSALLFSAAITGKSNGTTAISTTKTSTVMTANNPAVLAITSYVCSPAGPLPGDTVTCTATIKNTGGDATNITGTLSTPTNTTLGTGATFTIPTLAAGISTTRSVTGTVNSVAGGATINSTATITGASSAYGSPTSIPGAGTASNTLTVTASADLDMSGANSGPASAAANSGPITDMFTLKNNGPNNSTADVAVAFTVAPGGNNPTAVMILGAGACTMVDATHFSCTAGVALTAGNSTTIFVQFTAPPDAGSVAVAITATPHAGAPADPVAGNNTSPTVSTAITGVANLSITGSSATPGTAAAPILLPPAGTSATLHFVVHNGGPSSATGVTATVTIPAGATYNGPGSGDFSCPGTAVGSVTCTLTGSLASGADAVQDLNFTLNPLVASDSNQRVFNLSVNAAASLDGTHAGGPFTFFVENTPVVPAITLHATPGGALLTYNVVTGVATGGTGNGTVTPDPDDPAAGFSATATAATQGTSGPSTPTPGIVTLTYTPPATASGNDSFSYTFNDGKGGTGTNTVTVVFNATLTSIAVTPANPTVTQGTTRQFTATGTYSDGSTADVTASVVWASSNTSVATISAVGLASAVAQGTTTISATQGSVSGSTTLTVGPAALTSIAVTPANPTVAEGTTRQFTATGTYSDGSTADITASVVWASSNTSVATISAVGLASAVAQGTTTISATQGSVSGSTTMTVGPASSDLGVSIVAPSSAARRSVMAYTVVVANHGPSTANNVVLTDQIPFGATFQSITAPSGWSCTTPARGKTGTVTCTVASMLSNTYAATSLVVKVTARPNRGVINDVVTVTSTTPDPDSSNNQAVTTTVVSP